MTTASAPPPTSASQPDDFAAGFARLLSSQALTLPRGRALLLLRHLQRAVQASASLWIRTRLSDALEQAVERTLQKPSALRALRRWLPITPAPLQRELQASLEIWLRELSERQLDDLLPGLAVYLMPPRFGRGRDLVEGVVMSDQPIEALKEDKQRLQAELDRARAEFRNFEASFREERLRLEADHAELAGRRKESVQLNARLRQQVQRMHEMLEAADRESAVLREQRERLEAERREVTGSREEAARLNLHLSEQLEELRAVVSAAERERSRLREQGERLERELEQARAAPPEEKTEGPAPANTSLQHDIRVPRPIRLKVRRKTSPRREPAADDEPPERHVETGFASEDEPKSWIDPSVPLGVGRRYWFWLEITDEELPGSIETMREPLPRDVVSVGSRLTVVLFSLPGGLLLDESARSGEMAVAADGTVRVAQQPSTWDVADDAPLRETLRRRLLFPVTAPPEQGTATLRCSIYHGHTLVQSRLVRAMVTEIVGITGGGALTSTLDYTLSRTLRPAYLESIPDHRLSLMVNRNDDGTHGFYFWGERAFRGMARILESQAGAKIEAARKSMRMAAWGRTDAWLKENYRYQDGAVDLERLRNDLVAMASTGLMLYRGTVNELSEGRALELWELMRTPGSVQIVNKISPSFLLPAAFFYDHDGLDPGDPTNVGLCPEFLRAMEQADTPLEEQPCFRGECPNREAKQVVCPSGFWGFRHELGMPVSIRKATEAPPEIPLRDSPAFAISVFRGFKTRRSHMAQLRRLAAGWGWECANTRAKTLDLLAKTHAQIIYFYCHGGFDKGSPYLQVGGGGEGYIYPTSLSMKLRWSEPRPLVFINGCETAAVAPEQAFEFVRALVETHNAAGVIGTEITVFEPLASSFAQEFFERFLVKRQPLGRAMRGARLALLKQGNPLGLVYLPFALAGLHLEQVA